jgi:microsomal dipeptidase-like Zn-dependent dipeptidase
VLERIEQKRMIVDLAHASPRLIQDVLAVARRPVIVSHTGVRGTCDNIRNLSDEQLRQIAEKGGIVGIGYWDKAICDVSLQGIVRAIRHAVQVIGAEHVALGSDFDGATLTPFDTTGVAQIAEALRDAGLSLEQVSAILGGNVLRVFRELLP